MNKYQEALNVLYENVDYNDYSNQTIDRTNKAFDTLQELVDKSTPKKVMRILGNRDGALCPTCLRIINVAKEQYNYCPNCGQKLKWDEK